MSERPAPKRTKSSDPPAPPADEATPEKDDAGEMRSAHHIELGIVSLDAPPGWQFYPLEDRIVGRPASRVGVLQIMLLPPEKDLPNGATHEMLMSAAMHACCEYELNGPGTDPAKDRIEGRPAGGESFKAGNDFVRVWYSHRDQGLVAAWFACKAKRIAERSVKQLVHQCDKIVASIRLPKRADA